MPSLTRAPSSRSTSRFFIAFAMLAVSACARPEVDVKTQAGGPGDFCISAGDCTATTGESGGLQCLERRCCSDETCGTRCDALLASSLPEADAGAAPAHGDDTRRVHRPEERRLIRSTCISLCCQDRTAAEIEQVLSAPTFAPVHLVE